MNMKRKADFEYKTSLELVNRELEKYVVQENGFLTDIVRSFQSYITVIHQNTSTLIEGYDQEILAFLIKARQSTLEQEMVSNVRFFDEKITECQQKIIEVLPVLARSRSTSKRPRRICR